METHQIIPLKIEIAYKPSKNVNWIFNLNEIKYDFHDLYDSSVLLFL